jgi:hypothetical protein
MFTTVIFIGISTEDIVVRTIRKVVISSHIKSLYTFALKVCMQKHEACKSSFIITNGFYERYVLV